MESHLLIPAIILPASERTEQFLQPENTVLSGGNELILIVDDEAAICNSMKDTLTSVGYTVITAKNGEHAIELYTAQRDSIDMVILDMIMPKRY
jgi:response regulator RpfG family c-di-GMP phosphodiesterase